MYYGISGTTVLDSELDQQLDDLQLDNLQLDDLQLDDLQLDKKKQKKLAL